MAKKKKNIKKKRKAPASGKLGVKSPLKKKKKKIDVSQFFQVDQSSDRDPILRKIFFGCSIVILVLTLLMSTAVGINSDDSYQNDYSELVVDFYSSFGKDTSFMDYEDNAKIFYYGAFFEVIAGMTTSVMGLTPEDDSYHLVRHIWNAIFGVGVMIIAGLLVQSIGGWIPGILTLLFVFLSPRILGHSLMNPKDIPFAFGYLVSIFYMLRIFRQMPAPSWQNIVGLAVGFGISIGTRAGGLILVPYFLLFMAITGVVKHGIRDLFSSLQLLKKYIGYSILILFSGFAIGILLWPYALLDPLHHPTEALNSFTKVWTSIKVLYAGEMIWSADTPWHYSVQMLFRTSPVFIIIGCVGLLAFARTALKKFGSIPLSFLAFVAVFPVAYIIAKQSTLYDGIRHIIFVCPPLACLAALGWWLIYEKFSNKYVQYGLVFVLGITMLEAGIFTARNAAHSYVYFNPLVGGIKKTFGNYELDYWGTSVKKAFEWLEDQGIISADMNDTVVVASNFSYPLQKYAAKYNGKVKSVYVRWRQRNDKDWDYSIFVNRYVDGSFLRGGFWPTDKSIHTIDANGVPIAMIEKADPAKHAFLGSEAIRKKQWDQALAHYQQELTKYPNNDLALVGVGMAYLNKNQPQQAKAPLDRAIEITPESQNALNFAGYYSYVTGNYPEAKRLFTKAGGLHRTNSTAFFYLGRMELLAKNYVQALEHVQDCISANGRFKECYRLGIDIYQQMGDAAKAQAFQDALNKL